MIHISYAHPELKRLRHDAERRQNWKRWGPYLAERQWGTVREDYSDNGNAWQHFSYEDSGRRAYRWGEDGLLGFTDRQCRLCFAPALWNEQDSHLKERLFGLTGPEGNHGEDVKEHYYYVDSTPTHSYCKAVYKYPQSRYPYNRLRLHSSSRGLLDGECEIDDLGVFEKDEYFDLVVEYAKKSPNDILIRLTVHNRADKPAPIHLLPTLWFRNTWAWGNAHEGCTLKPMMQLHTDGYVEIEHDTLGAYRYWATMDGQQPEWIFTENETNLGAASYTKYVKDAFHRYVVNNEKEKINPEQKGTKVAPYFLAEVPANGKTEILCRLTSTSECSEETSQDPFGEAFQSMFDKRIAETDSFYDLCIDPNQSDDEKAIQRQAYAGLLWTKQFYHYSLNDWLKGDVGAQLSENRKQGRNSDWKHLYAKDIISMPDKWEYPWFAAWDLAFHMIPFCRIDPQFAKDQLILFLREWYMHPNGQIPAYEWNFSDVNPPVHAWAVWRVYKMTGPRGQRDKKFLKHAFLKLMLNFNWWVNRKDESGKNLFSGGFLGLDNIGAFDRSMKLPDGARLQQSDGTAWMAFFCGTMLSIALELSQDDSVYDTMASKFFEHFMNIADAMNTVGESGLWNDEDGFYNDKLQHGNTEIPIRIRSLVGLMPLIAVEVIDEEMTAKLPSFQKRMKWFLDYRKDLKDQISFYDTGRGGRHLLAIPSKERLRRVLEKMLDEDEFLSPYGIRSLSKYHEKKPFNLHFNGNDYNVHYTPGEADTTMFGGNSNWRGPVWLPINYLLVETLEKYHYFYGSDFQIECPTGSGNLMTLKDVSKFLEQRLSNIFQLDENGDRPLNDGNPVYRESPHYKDHILFYEYFHADTGAGVGASHQTGWTALIAEILKSRAEDKHREHSK